MRCVSFVDLTFCTETIVIREAKIKHGYVITKSNNVSFIETKESVSVQEASI